MAIPYEIPGKFIAEVLAGKLIRNGTLIQDAATGQILGHVKEVGGLIADFGPANLVSNVGQHAQLFQLQQAMESLQLVASIGAVASVASLGVSIAGFAVVIKKLNKIEGKLDSLALEVASISKSVEELGLKWDLMTQAKIEVAAEQQTQGLVADTERRRIKLFEDSAKQYSEMKHYYFGLFESLDPWNKHDIPPITAYEIYSRAVACALGQLESEFLLNDWGAFHHIWEKVRAQVAHYSDFDPKVVYRVRSDEATKVGKSEHFLTISSDLPDKIISVRSGTKETLSRIDTYIQEAKFVQHSGMTSKEYVDELRKESESSLKLVLWQDKLKKAS